MVIESPRLSLPVMRRTLFKTVNNENGDIPADRSLKFYLKRHVLSAYTHNCFHTGRLGNGRIINKPTEF